MFCSEIFIGGGGGMGCGVPDLAKLKSIEILGNVWVNFVKH